MLEIDLGVFRPSFSFKIRKICKVVEPPRLKSSFLPRAHRSHAVSTALSVFHPAQVQKALYFPKRNSIFMPCLELEHSFPSRETGVIQDEHSKANTNSRGNATQVLKGRYQGPNQFAIKRASAQKTPEQH